MPVKKLRVGVIYGGRSGEHEVSLASAAAVFKHLDRAALRSRRHPHREGRPLDARRPGRRRSPRPPRSSQAGERRARRRGAARRTWSRIRAATRSSRSSGATIRSRVVSGLGLDVVFPVLHGPYGEDGTVQGLLELANVPYVGAGVLASAVGMDKAVMKLLFAARGLPSATTRSSSSATGDATSARSCTRVVDALGFPVFVKPANLGSSVGISKAKHAAELRAAIDLAAEFDRKIVVEAAVPEAREIECAVLGNDEPEASVPGEIIPSREFYDYEAKYLDEGSTLGDSRAADAKRRPKRCGRWRSRRSRRSTAPGMARVDFLLAGDSGGLYVNEVNTIPGFTTISMYSKMWEASGLSYPALLDRLIALALERHAEKQQLRTSM